MRRLILPAVLLFVVVVASAALRADTIYLEDGKKIEGTAVEEGDNVKITTKMGVITVPKAKVKKIEKDDAGTGGDKASVYKEKAAALKDNDAEGHYQLGLWCKKGGLRKEAQAEFEKTIAINADHAGARDELGFVKVDGNWVKGEKGKIYADGAWIKPDEAVDRAKGLYKLEKYPDAADVLTKAVNLITKREMQRDAWQQLGLTDERLGKWDEACSAYDKAMSGATPEQKGNMTARKQIIKDTPGGMYLIKEATGKEDIFSIDNEHPEKTKNLTGLQPLTNPYVMEFALREKCLSYIDKGKDLLKKAKDANDGTEKGEEKCFDTLDRAETEFTQANLIVKDIARGFLVECTKQRIGVFQKSFGVQAARLNGVLASLNGMTRTKAKDQCLRAIAQLNVLEKSLNKIDETARKFPDELSQECALCKENRAQINQLRVQLQEFARGLGM